MDEDTQVAVHTDSPNTAVTEQTSEREGFEEGFDPTEITPPMAKLLQFGSPEAKDENSPFKAGQIINTATQEELPDTFIPLFKRTMWIKFNPQSSQDPAFDSAYPSGGVVYRTTDPKDPVVLAEGHFKEDGTKPTITRFMNFLCYFPGQPMPVIVSFGKTSFKTGRKLFGSLNCLCQKAMYEYKFKLVSKKESKNNNDYYVYDIVPAGKADQDDFDIAKALFKKFNQHNVTKVEEDLKTEEVEKNWEE